MGSGNSCMGSHPSGSRSQLSRSGTAMSKRSKLSFLICGASSGSHTHTPFQVENHLTKSTARPLEKKASLNSVSLKPMEQPSPNCTSETGFSSSSPDSGASSEGIHGTVVESSAEFGLINHETCSSGKCLSENDGLVPHPASAHSTPVEFHRESSETSGITFKEQSSLESVDRPSSSVAQEPANLCLVEESILDAAKGFHSSDSDSGSASVVPDSPENCQLLQDDSAERVTSSGLGSIVSATEQDSRNRSRLQVDMVSISSDTLFRGISDVSNREARSSRGMFWDTFSRRSFRQHSDSPMIVFATSHADRLRSHDRWLHDFSDLHYDGFGHDFRHPGYGGHHRRERRRWSRYESSERFHSDLDDEDRHMSFCASGLHPNGRCTCGTFFSAEEPSIHASIFQILMLADALFEVLDEIHHHPVSDSPSVLSLPAPVDVVDSFPLKNHKKVEATENGAQCYICLAEYEEEDFPAPALALMETLLSIDPADRGSAASALKSEFFTTKPLPCDPSILPKYPPSKEFDAKIRDEEARRQGAAGNKGQRIDLERRGTRESRAIPAPDANAELVLSIQKRQGQSNSKSRSEKFNPHPEEVASGFPIDPPRPSQAVEGSMETQEHHHKRASHSGPLAHRAAWAKAGKNLEDAAKISTGAELSTMSSFGEARRMSEDRRQRSNSSQPEIAKFIGRFPGSFKEGSDFVTQQDQKHHSQGIAGSHKKEDAKFNNKDPILLGYGSKGHKIHYSGPLIVPSGNMDQVLKDHDRQIQEAVRRARLDKAKVRKAHVEGNQISTNALFVSGR